MKRILIAGALAFTAGGQALAADIPPSAPPPRAPAAYVPSVAPAYSWGGVYIGANGGGGFGSSEWTNTAVIPQTTGSFNTSGGLAGGTLGVNFQANQFVFGAEGDFDWSNIKGSTTGNGYCALPVVPAGVPATTCETKNKWLGTARGRIGWAADRVLLYATGGAAFGNVQTGLSGGGVTTPTYDTTTKTGWTAGGGVEVAFGEFWSGKVEYLYVDLGSVNCSTPANCGITTPQTPSSVSFTAHTIKAGINFRFGGGTIINRPY